jgi:drug/metabolite transporter (DMT)-like permease
MKWLLLLLVVGPTIASDLLQSYEMKRSGAQSVGARGLGQLIQMIVSRKFLILAILCMAISFFAFMALLQRAPLSFAVPASAATIVFETLLARLFLKEAVGFRRIAGAALVSVGVLLIAK